MPGFLKGVTPTLNLVRSLHRRKFIWYGEGIKYPGFTYYPRHPDFKDPPYEPSKLFMVKRIKELTGAPHWEKNILKEFKLDGKLNDYAIVKNIPENNHRLYRVKHLIQIKPITYPDGFPTENDRTFLQENGELRIIKTVIPHKEKLQLSENFEKNPKKMDGDTLRRYQRKKWLNAWDTTC